MNFKAREKFIKKNLNYGESYLTLCKEDIYYLSGFHGSFSLLLISNKKSFLFVDGRYYEKAKKLSNINEIILFTDLWKELKTIINTLKIKKIIFDGDSITYNFYKKLSQELSSVELVTDDNKMIKKMREIKDEDEIKVIRKAVSKSLKAYEDFFERYRLVNLSEIECVNYLEFNLKKYGEGISFDTLILSGSNSSVPHGTPSKRIIEWGDTVIIDFGLKYKHYCTDHTRTWLLRNHKMEKYLQIVQLAFDEGLKKIGDGKEIKEVDIAIRNVFEKNNVLSNFLHSSGHGIGLSVHESPTISYKTEGVFKEGMIVTLEPGLYFEGIGGIRHEEMILVTKNGCEIL